MGMFDKPKYLTGEGGYAEPGDTFYLHRARLDGTTKVRGEVREQAKLLVSRTPDGNNAEVVYTSGVGIVNQVRRMDAADRATFPIEVRLDQVPSGKGNPTNVLTPADQSPPSSADAISGGEDSPSDF